MAFATVVNLYLRFNLMPYSKSDFSALVAEYLDISRQIRKLQEQKLACTEKLEDIYRLPIEEEDDHYLELVEHNLIAIDGEWVEIKFDCEDGSLIRIHPTLIKIL